MILEIATTDFVTTKQAVEAGADRIELCAALVEGGTTPSAGTIIKCRETFDVALFPIIRPRGGDFLYTDDEFEIMMHEVKLCKQVGCDGIVVGMLTTDGKIDLLRAAKVIEAAYPLEVTIHRAFDRSANPFEAMEQLIDLGCQRILTSGQKKTAIEGVELIAELIGIADGRIIIMPGSGVRRENLLEIKNKTGATEFHTSLRTTKASAMAYRHPSFAAEDFKNSSINTEELKEIKEMLKTATPEDE